MCGSRQRARKTRTSCCLYLDRSVSSLTRDIRRKATAPNPAIVEKASFCPRPTMVSPVWEPMHREFEIAVDKLRINTFEICIGLVTGPHYPHKAIAQFFLRHAEGDDIGAIFVAGFSIVQPTSLFKPIVKGRRWDGVQHAYKRGRDLRLGQEISASHRRSKNRHGRSRRSCRTRRQYRAAVLYAHALSAFQPWPHILQLFGFSKRILVRRLDANEDTLEIGKTQ